MIKGIYILLISFLINNIIIGQFWKNNREEQLQQEAVEDLGALPTADHFKYIEKFHKGVREMIGGNLPEAKELFKACIDEYPHDDAVYFALGEIAKRQNLKSEALKYYLKAHERDPNNIHYTQEVAFMQFEKAMFDEAIVNFKKLVEREPRHPQWLYGYAQALLYGGEYEAAITAFDKFQDQIGPVPEVTMIKIELYEMLKQEDKIEEELLTLKRAHPQNLEVLKNVIGYYEEKGEEEKAIELIKELVESEPNNGVAHFILAKNFLKKDEIENFYNSALIVAKSQEIDVKDKVILFQSIFAEDLIPSSQVVNISENLVIAHPENTRLNALHAEILTEQGRTFEAVEFFVKALKTEESEYQIWVNTLAFFSAFKEYKLLYEFGVKGLELFPSLPFMYYAAAEGAIYAADIDEALEYIEMGSMFVIDDEQQLGKLTLRKGQALYEKGNLADGKKAFENAKNLLNDDGVDLHIAYLKAKKEQDLKEGMKVVEELINKRKLGSRNYYEIGYILMKNNQLERAEKFLKTAISEAGFTAEILDLLGDIYIKKGDEANAITYWKKAKNSESRNKIIPQKIEDRKYHAPKYY